MTVMRSLCLFLLLMALTTLAPLQPAHASLTISPLRVVFDGRTRSADVMLINTSNETNTYRVGWVYNKMDTHGAYDRVEKTLTPAFDVGQGVLYSPRQVTIPGQGRQKVRLSLRRPPDLADGEYRAHLVFQKLPNASDVVPRDNSNAPKRGQTLSLSVLLGFSIPVIVRQGEYDCNVAITTPEFVAGNAQTGGKPQIKFKLTREGKHGAIGRILVTWDKSKDPYQRIGVLNNVSLFPEINERDVAIDLMESAISGGTVTIRYYGDGPQKGEILAEKSFSVGG